MDRSPAVVVYGSVDCLIRVVQLTGADNFTEMASRLDPKESTKVYSASGDGKVPFVACDDIAAVAFQALVDDKPHNTDHMILGPELLSYKEVC